MYVGVYIRTHTHIHTLIHKRTYISAEFEWLCVYIKCSILQTLSAGCIMTVAMVNQVHMFDISTITNRFGYKCVFVVNTHPPCCCNVTGGSE